MLKENIVTSKRYAFNTMCTTIRNIWEYDNQWRNSPGFYSDNTGLVEFTTFCFCYCQVKVYKLLKMQTVGELQKFYYMPLGHFIGILVNLRVKQD